MANPNIAGLTTVHGKFAGLKLASTSATPLVYNDTNVAANKVFKINSIVISNVDSTNSATVDVILRNNYSVDYHLAKGITVQANATLVVVSKDTQLYLEEDHKILVTASAANRLEAICSYEEIS